MGKGTFLCAFLSSRVDEEKGATKDEMAGWHHQVSEHEFEQAPGDGAGQGSLACCGPWGRAAARGVAESRTLRG